RSEESKSIESALKNNPNLLIKGNNLIALHCLKYKYAKQVKLIYIDPPYNTGNDSFNYNDRFNHSTYLCFMKNRLEIARELLRDDGVIFVQCDDNEQAYLKVLMDEIFGRENFICNFIWRKRAGGGNDSKFVAIEHENILAFSKKILHLKMFALKRNDLSKYKIDEKGYYLEKPLNDTALQDSPGLHYDIELPNGITLKGKEHQWKMSHNKFIEKKSNNEILFKSNNKVYYKHYIDIESGILPTSIMYNLVLNSSGTKEIKGIFTEKLFATPKPEALLQRIIEISTNENDLVLDFFAGSGTTLAVAHKMKRKYIGIEQMEYIESITKERLKKVIDGESGGISKAIEWSGGGSFIYCELAPLNASFIEKIENSRDENELNKIYEDLQKLAFIDYRVDIQSDLNDSEFVALSFEEKKRILKKCLDRNMDYIPYADMEDSEYKIDEQTRILNDIFYKKVEMI
ncbi:site-specific DNA-methyltransferase, partial [Helicobacter equorum]